MYIQIENKNTEIEILEKEKMEKKSELLSAIKNKKILEELKKKKFRGYNLLVNKKEQELFDNIAIIKYHEKIYS